MLKGGEKMKMARLYNKNGSHSCITFKQQANGFKVNNDFYDASGIYVAHKSFTFISKDWDYDRLLQEIESAKSICTRVDIY